MYIVTACSYHNNMLKCVGIAIRGKLCVPVDQSINRSINQSCPIFALLYSNQKLCKHWIRCFHLTTQESISNQPINQPINQSVNQSVDQSVNQPMVLIVVHTFLLVLQVGGGNCARVLL